MIFKLKQKIVAAYEKGYVIGHTEGFLAAKEKSRQLSLSAIMQRIEALEIRITHYERLMNERKS